MSLSASVFATTFVTVTPDDDLRAIVESAANDTVITLAAGTHDLGSHTPFNQGILIQNKHHLTIRGKGPNKTRLRLPSDAQFGFYTGSNVTNLTIKNLHLEGTPPLTTNTHAIGNFSGTTNVRDVKFTQLRISNTAVGISADTSTTGLFDGVSITDNEILGTVGLDPGWGYGIEIANATNVLVANNHIEEATRHSIYVARAAAGSNIQIERNTILNHDRFGLQRSSSGRWYLAALAVTRASDVDVLFNRIINPRAIALSVEPDEIHGWPVEEVNLVGNEIIDAWYVGMWAVTDATHAGLGNQISHRPNPDADRHGWGDETSTFNYATGTATSSAFVPPRLRWNKVDHIAGLNGSIFVMHDGVLDRITSTRSWAYESGHMDWQGTDSMLALAEAGDDGKGRVQIIRDGLITHVHPETWGMTVAGAASVSLVTSGSWGEPDHWSNGTVPGPGWEVSIDSETDTALTASLHENAQVRSILIQGSSAAATLEIAGGVVLTVTHGITVGAGGTLTVHGTVHGEILNQGGTVILTAPEPCSLVPLGALAFALGCRRRQP